MTKVRNPFVDTDIKITKALKKCKRANKAQSKAQRKLKQAIKAKTLHEMQYSLKQAQIALDKATLLARMFS